MTNQTTESAPKATERPVLLEKHGDVRSDPFFWMKERENPEVLSYLEAENEWYNEKMRKVEPLREEIYRELRSRVNEDESVEPFRIDDFYYYSRYEAGKEYPIHARKRTLDGAEEIILDVNELADGLSYCDVWEPVPSPDHSKIAYAMDAVGRRFYTIHVKDLSTGKLVGEPLTETTGNVEWANDNKTLFFTKQDQETLRPQWLFKHTLNSLEPTLVFEEVDNTFGIWLSKTLSSRFLLLNSHSTLSSEVRFLDADKPQGTFTVFHPREQDHEYSIDDGGDCFFVRSNWNAKNFRLLRAQQLTTTKADWIEVLPHNPDILIEFMEVFKNHLVLTQRNNGLRNLQVIHRKTGATKNITFPDPTYVVDTVYNCVFDTDTLRYEYQSLNQPRTIFDYHFTTGQSMVRKIYHIPNLDTESYASERIWATASDGAQIPVSLVYKKGFRRDGSAALFQYAYGSYGFSMNARFKADVMSLLDRGFVFAMAHIRGGAEMGRLWYENGKLLQKKNTFTDFIDVTEFLLRKKFAHPKRVYAEGGSAGGLLMGAVVNMRPDLYRGVHAAVPFVDVLTTMLDDTIPLTTAEYDEWGNPNQQDFYHYIKSYSPYDNVEKKAYPNLLVTSGLHDSQVQYWEPTKWVAKLRKYAENDPLILLRTEMTAGHGGASGRFSKLRNRADEIAFFLMLDSAANCR